MRNSAGSSMRTLSIRWSTVIGWIHGGDFPGAYRLNGREWLRKQFVSERAGG